MKKIQLTFIAFLLSLSFYAQGISVQGIARDDENAAITNKQLQFTFQIVSDNSVIFSEEEQIQTDGFGVFSHIVSTGTADISGDKVAFSEIDFSVQNMRLKVFVDLSGNIEVYDQAFQYTPYAHYAKAADTAKSADNGVPPGTIVAFLGADDKIPTGWVKCKGQDISSGSEYANLRDLFGSTIPDLRGRYLRGQGVSSNLETYEYDQSTIVGEYLRQSLAAHLHHVNLETTEAGVHRHKIYHDIEGVASAVKTASGNDTKAFGFQSSNQRDGDEGFREDLTDRVEKLTAATPDHKHTTVGYSAENFDGGSNNYIDKGEENRPHTVVINYIIKL
jgi:microcystin-dependent protein